MDAASAARSLKRFWYLPVLGALAAVAAATVLSAAAVPVYEARSTYIVSPALGTGADPAESIRTLEDTRSRAVVSTYLAVLASGAVEREALATLALDPRLADDYEVRAVLLPEANVVEMTVTGPSPEIALALSETIGASGSATFEDLYQIYDIGLLDPPELPTAPAGPSLTQTAAMAAALGILAGGAVGVLAGLPGERKQQAVRTRIERYGGSGTATVTALPVDRDERYSRIG